MKPNERKLVINIDERLRHSIKTHALKQHMTIKNWVLSAIAKQMDSELEKEIDETVKE